MDNHPNFPERLDIKPSKRPVNIGEKNGETDDKERVFGLESQRSAIAQFGIAGRVW